MVEDKFDKKEFAASEIEIGKVVLKDDTTSATARVANDAVFINLQNLNNATPSSTNALPSRLTDGTSFYDARSIRALTISDEIFARLKDSSGTGITSTLVGSKQSLDVNVTQTVGGGTLTNDFVSVTSTTTPLGSTATFTSSTFSTDGYDRITGTVFADQSGTLRIDQSSDGGTNFDFTSEFSVTANTGVGFSVEAIAPTARIRYTNGATAQGTFRLYAFTRVI